MTTRGGSPGTGPAAVVAGRAAVLGELAAAGPLLAGLRAPVPARAPWLATVLAVSRRGTRPVAVTVRRSPGTRPDALALLELHRRGAGHLVTLLGDGTGPVPPGAPPARLAARDDTAADGLAAALLGHLDRYRRPWTLRLSGLPLGDPTLAALGHARPDGAFATSRSARLVDELDPVGGLLRTRDPGELDRWLPALLDRAPDDRAAVLLRAAARLHASIGQLELAVAPGGTRPRAGLLTLVDGAARLPWWGFSDVGGLRTEMAAPVVSFTLRTPARIPGLSRRR